MARNQDIQQSADCEAVLLGYVTRISALEGALVGMAYLRFRPGRATQPFGSALEKVRSAPQFLQTPTLAPPAGAGSIQWCAQSVV